MKGITTRITGKTMAKRLILSFSFAIVLFLSINLACAAGAWNIETIDSTFNDYNSLALDSSNNPHISYSRITDPESTSVLYYAKKTGSTWTRQSVNQFGTWSSSMKISSSGYPHIIFQDGSGRDLKYANLTPSRWEFTNIDLANLVGADPSIALDSANNPYVSYLYETGSDLRYAHYVGSGGNCFSTRWQCTNVDTSGTVGWYTSITLDSSKNPHISYVDWGNQKLKYAHYVGSGGNCGSNAWQCTTIDSSDASGGSTSIAFGPDGKPRIAYSYNGVKYASYVGAGSSEANCGSGEWKCVTVEGSGGKVSMAMDSSGNPHLAYIQGGNLRYSSFDGATWSMETVDATGGWYKPSLALDSYGQPHISYYHYISSTSGEIKYAYLSCPDSDSDGYTSALCGGEDCDDAEINTHPGAAEVCDGKDNDCNAATADGSGEYAPLNDNQIGVCAGSQKTCSGAAGWQNSYASIPGYTATETTANCDGTDNDCDGQTDEGCACISGATQNCGPATDAGECVYGTQTCSAGAWGICVGAVMPSQETCDNKDNDCDGQTDEGCDDDNDNYCDSSMTRVGTPSTCTAVGGDCNDANAAIHPGATEICDNKDNNCDATIDEGFDLQTDMNNCGSCNNVCAAGENCIAGVCTPPQILSQCSDSIDNDNNGCADYPTDSGCYGLTDMTEVGGICPVALSDTSDNDFTICHGPDSDNDGICDRFDNCWHGPNPDQADADGDCEAKKLLPEYWDGTGWLQDPKCGDACVCTIPYDGMEVTEDTLLCKGEYGITDAQKDGVIKMMKNGVTLDCNDAIIRSKAKCNLPGDANYNGYYDYEDVYLISQIYDKIYNEYITQFDSCGDDFNQDGVVDENEHKGVASAITNHIKSVDCTAAGYVKGDYNENGMLDNHDLLIYYSLPGIDIEPACGDVNGDGVVDGDDATAINTEISSSLAIDRDRKTCTRYGNEYPLGDVSYNGIVDYADINLISAMNNGRTDVDYCGDVDGDDAVTPIDINILHNQINFNSPPCGLVGDINRNNRLEGGDLYLLQEMASGSIPPDMICGNVHEDGVRCTKTGEQTIFKPGPSDCSLNPCPSGYTCNPRRLIDQNDADALLDKMSVKEGTGISLADFNGVTIKNCNIYNYTYGIKVENSDSSIFHHNQLYNTNYDIYFDADSDGTQLYYNHLYKTGVNPEESACTAEDLAADLCNDYCSLIDEKEIGNYYGRDVGVINNLATGVVKDENIGHDDCGVVEITKPSPNEKLKTDQVDITFRRQTSKNTPLTYYLDYSTDNKATWNKIEGTATNPMTDTLAEDYTYHWSTSFIYQALDIRITPFDNYLNATPSMLHFEIDRRGNVEGKVQCCEGADCEPVDGAEVCYLSQCSPPAGEDGIYLLENVPSGMQSIVASSAGRRSQKKDVEVKAQDIVGADFTNVCPVTVDCNPDCTVVGTEKDPYPICEPTCDGVNGCDIFSDETAKVSCGYAARGSRMEYKKDDTTYYAVCCEGPWYKVPPEEKSKFVVDAENIARTTRIVYKGGRPVRMIVVTWD